MIYRSLVFITIFFIFNFDSEGYCLRVPIENDYAKMRETYDQVADSRWVPMEEFNRSILLNKDTGRIKLAEMPPVVDIDFDLWIVRHGETEGNLTRGLFQGAVDEAVNQLNEKGKRQSKDAAKILFKRLYSEIEAGNIVVVSSRLKRAKDTAEKFVELVNRKKSMNISIIEEELAIEMSYGAVDNKTPDQLSADQQAFVTRYRQGLDATAIPEGGENFINVLKRSKDLLTKLNKLYKGKTVVLFGHGIQTGAIRALLGDRTLLDRDEQIDWRKNIIPNAAPKLFMSRHSSYIADIIKYDINISNKDLFEGRTAGYLVNNTRCLEDLAALNMNPVRLARVYMMLADMYGRYLPGRLIDKERSLRYEALANETVNKIVLLNRRVYKDLRISRELYNSECVVTVPARIELGSALGSDLTGISYGEGGIALNIAVDIEGYSPSQVRIRRINDLMIRLISIDKNITEVILNKGDILNYKNRDLNLVRACLVETGIINAEDDRELKEILRDFGGGIEIITNYKLDKENGDKLHAGGLGGSSNLAAGILKALYVFSGQEISNQDLIKATVRVEGMLELGGGWQDGVGGVYGGVKFIKSRKNDIDPIPNTLSLSENTISELRKRLVLFYSGEERDKSGRKDLLNHNVVSYLIRDSEAMAVREKAKGTTIKMVKALNLSNMSELGRLLKEYWGYRVINKPVAQTEFIKYVMDTVWREGLVEGYNSTGAGGGGCYVFIAKEGKEYALRKRLNELGRKKGGRTLDWSINKKGLSVIVKPILAEHDYELPFKDFEKFVSKDRPGFGVERNLMAEYSLWARTREILDKLRVGEEPDIVLDEIEIQPDSVCNMRCSHCRREFLSNNGTTKISEENMVHIIESIIDHNKSHPGRKIRKIRFSGFTGEPLMNKKALFKGMELAKKGGLSVGLFTNGALLNNEARQAAVENASYVHVSLDAGSEESLEIIKRRRGFKEIIENIEELAVLRAKQGSSVGITIGYILHKSNIPEIYNAVRLMKAAGADIIRFNIDIYRAKRDGLSPEEIEMAYKLIDTAKRDFEDEKFKVVILHQKDEVIHPVAEESNMSGFKTCYFSRLVNVIGDDSVSYACYHTERLPDEDPRRYGVVQGVDYLKLYKKGHTKWARKNPADYCDLCPAQGYRINIFFEFLQQSEKTYPGFLDYIEHVYVIPVKIELAERLASSGKRSDTADLYDEIAYLYYKHGDVDLAYAAIDKRNSLVGQPADNAFVLCNISTEMPRDAVFKKGMDISDLILRHENFIAQLKRGKLQKDIDTDPDNAGTPLLDWVDHAEAALIRGRDELNGFSKQASLLRERYNFFIFVGMGGSINPIKTLGDNEDKGIYILDNTTTEAVDEMLWRILKAYDADFYEKAREVAAEKDIEKKHDILMRLFKPALAKTFVFCFGKTGGTKEMAVNRDFFMDVFKQSGLSYQEHMMAMGDPGNFQNQALAFDVSFQAAAVLGKTHNPDRFGLITGKFLLPMALLGKEPVDILSKSLKITGTVDNIDENNSFIRLASILYASAVLGNDKITLILPRKLQPLSEHIEQMFEESLDKDGKGFHVFYGEEENSFLRDNSNRIFFCLTYKGMSADERMYFDNMLARLRDRPVIKMDIGTDDEAVAKVSFMLGLQRTIAAIGYLWDINFVTQDAVKRYKEIGQEDYEESTGTIGTMFGSASKFGRIVLYSDSVSYDKLTNSEDAADVLRSILEYHIINTKLEDKTVSPFVDIAFYGSPSDEMKSVMSRFKKSIAGTFEIPVKETLGLARNHAIHQGEIDGPQGGLSVYIIPLFHSWRGIGIQQQGDFINQLYALSTAKAMKAAGRQVVIITIQKDDASARKDLINFITKVIRKQENGLQKVFDRQYASGQRIKDSISIPYGKTVRLFNEDFIRTLLRKSGFKEVSLETVQLKGWHNEPLVVVAESLDRLPFNAIKVPVMNSVEEMQEFVHKWKDYRFCTYLAYKDDKGWEESTSRRYMNKVLPGFIYLPINIKAGDNEALERFYRICENEDAIIAINHTQPHKSNPVAKRLFGIQEDNFDTLVKNDKNKFIPYSLNGDAFSSWFSDEVGSYEGKDIVIFGVGGAGESIARNIINFNPRAVYLIDAVPKEQLSNKLGGRVAYFNNLGEMTSKLNGADGVIFIFTAGKEFNEGLEDCLSFLEKHRDRQNVFVDIRPYLELKTVKKAEELGWRAYTGNGMNARNDHVLLMKIAEKMVIGYPSSEDFKQRVHEDSFLSIRQGL